MFFKKTGGEMKPTPKVEKMTHVTGEDKDEIRKMSNALKQRKFARPFSDNAFHDPEAFDEPNGAKFDAEGKGFLALTKNDAEGTAAIKVLRADARDPAVLHELLEKAITYLKDKGIHEVTVKVSEELHETEHVLHDFGFHREDEEGDMRILKAHI